MFTPMIKSGSPVVKIAFVWILICTNIQIYLQPVQMYNQVWITTCEHCLCSHVHWTINYCKSYIQLHFALQFSLQARCILDLLSINYCKSDIRLYWIGFWRIHSPQSHQVNITRHCTSGAIILNKVLQTPIFASFHNPNHTCLRVLMEECWVVQSFFKSDRHHRARQDFLRFCREIRIPHVLVTRHGENGLYFQSQQLWRNSDFWHL